jgi:hypothetical protein
MFAETDTRWAPWKVVDGNNQKAARIAVLTHIVEQMTDQIPQEFPAIDPDIEKLAATAFKD